MKPDHNPSGLAPAPIRKLLARAAALVTLVLAVPSLLALLGSHHWAAGLCSELRIQWTLGLLFVLVVSVVSRAWKTADVAVLLTGLCSVSILPHLSAPDTATGIKQLRVVTANVYSRNDNHKLIESELNKAQADVVVVVELTKSLHQHLQRAFRSTHPHSIVSCEDGGNFGIGLYSARPFAEKSILHFNSPRLPCVAVTIDCDGDPVHLLAIHTLPPVGRTGFVARNEELSLIAEYVGDRDDSRVVVLEDLNLTPWSPIYHNFLTDAGLTSAGQGNLTPTWYQFSGFPFGLILDHILVERDLGTTDYRVSEHAGSDHRFVSAALRWE